MKGRVGVLVALGLFAPLSVVVATPGASGGHPEREASTLAHVGFGHTVSDDEVRALAHRHGLVPEAVFMSVAGLTGTHRSYVAQSPDAFVKSARARAIASLQSSLKGNQLRLREFLSTYSLDAVERDQSIAIQARSLLNINVILKRAVAETQQNLPLVYALEISGPPERLEALQREPIVQAFQRGTERNGVAQAPDVAKPQAYQEEPVDPGVAASGIREVYDALRASNGS